MKDFFKWIPESGLEPWFETAPYQPRRLVPVAPEGGARLLFHDVRSRRGAYAASTPHRLFSCSDLRLIYGPSNELTEEYLTSSW